jgi:hypothetical protein
MAAFEAARFNRSRTSPRQIGSDFDLHRPGERLFHLLFILSAEKNTGDFLERHHPLPQVVSDCRQD